MNFFFDLLRYKITSPRFVNGEYSLFQGSDRRIKLYVFLIPESQKVFLVGASLIPSDYYQNLKAFCFDLVFGKNRFNVENKYV
jgi:hypothetical protein